MTFVKGENHGKDTVSDRKAFSISSSKTLARVLFIRLQVTR